MLLDFLCRFAHSRLCFALGAIRAIRIAQGGGREVEGMTTTGWLASMGRRIARAMMARPSPLSRGKAIEDGRGRQTDPSPMQCVLLRPSRTGIPAVSNESEACCAVRIMLPWACPARGHVMGALVLLGGTTITASPAAATYRPPTAHATHSSCAMAGPWPMVPPRLENGVPSWRLQWRYLLHYFIHPVHCTYHLTLITVHKLVAKLVGICISYIAPLPAKSPRDPPPKSHTGLLTNSTPRPPLAQRFCMSLTLCCCHLRDPTPLLHSSCPLPDRSS